MGNSLLAVKVINYKYIVAKRAGNIEKSTFSALSLSEATTGFEPVIEVLQTFALPLGYVALSYLIIPLTSVLVKN